jgi:hypothetical protein
LKKTANQNVRKTLSDIIRLLNDEPKSVPEIARDLGYSESYIYSLSVKHQKLFVRFYVKLNLVKKDESKFLLGSKYRLARGDYFISSDYQLWIYDDTDIKPEKLGLKKLDNGFYETIAYFSEE